MANEHQEEAVPPVEETREPESPGTVVANPAPRKAPAQPRPGRLPPYKVLLHNDDVNTFEHAIRAILRLTHLPTEEAVRKALTAHEQGVALLLVTHKERAELYQEQFTSLSLTVTIEPDA